MRFLHYRFRSLARKLLCLGLCITLLDASGFCGVADAASLYDAINLTGEYEGKTPPEGFTFDGDVTLGQGEAGALPEGERSLGTLKRAASDTPRVFTINGCGNTLNGNSCGGITVDNKEDVLNISNLTVESFSGTFARNNGTINITGTVILDNLSSISGEGKLNIADAASLTIAGSSFAAFSYNTVTNDGTLTLQNGGMIPTLYSSLQLYVSTSTSSGRGMLNFGKGNNTISGEIRNQDINIDGTLKVGSSTSGDILDATDTVTLENGGKIDISDPSYGTPVVGRVVQLKDFKAEGENSKIVFNTELSRDADGKAVAKCDSIQVTEKAEGKVNLDLSADSSSHDILVIGGGSNIINNGFEIGDSATISLFKGGDLSGLNLVGQTLVTSTGIIYKFTELTGDEIKTSDDRGKLHVEALEGYSLYDAINLTGMAEDIVPDSYALEEDVTLGVTKGAGTLPKDKETLGKLARKVSDSARSFSINGNKHELNGNGKCGILINTEDSLSLSNLTVSGFKGAFITNNGMVTLGNVTMHNSLVNNGTINISSGAGSLGGGSVTFAPGNGVSGAGNIEIGLYCNLTINADDLGNKVINRLGTLNLTGGTLTKEVTSESPSGFRSNEVKLQAPTVIAAPIENHNITLNDVSLGYSTVPNQENISGKKNCLIFGTSTWDEEEGTKGALDLQNGKASVLYVNTKLVNDGYLKLDADLAANEIDRFDGSSSVAQDKQLHITSLALLTDAANDITNIRFTDDLSLADAVRYDGAPHIASLTQEYAVAYDNETGRFFFTKSGASESTKSIYDTASAANTVWMANINNLQKRLGDLRSGEESNTGWVRFQRSNDDLNNGRNLNVSGNLYQIGYDFALKNDASSRGYFGLSLERFDGNQSFKIGGGDIKSTTLSAYYTKIYESGHYFDFIFRYGKYDSDTTSYDTTPAIPVSTKLDYAMNGVTLSGEYGYRWNFGKGGLYLEPQAEFIYGYLSGAKKTSSTGILADIDSTNHFITRWGVALGQKVKNFNYYLRASYFHDFAGATSVKYGTASYKEDGAKNWWEVSVGGGWNITDTSYFYAELTKHFKDVSNSLNFNLGFRLTL